MVPFQVRLVEMKWTLHRALGLRVSTRDGRIRVSRLRTAVLPITQFISVDQGNLAVGQIHPALAGTVLGILEDAPPAAYQLKNFDKGAFPMEVVQTSRGRATEQERAATYVIQLKQHYKDGVVLTLIMLVSIVLRRVFPKGTESQIVGYCEDTRPITELA